MFKSPCHRNRNRARTSHFRDYFVNRITILWNSLPDDIKLATSLDSFKRNLYSSGAYIAFSLVIIFTHIRLFVQSAEECI